MKLQLSLKHKLMAVGLAGAAPFAAYGVYSMTREATPDEAAFTRSIEIQANYGARHMGKAALGPLHAESRLYSSASGPANDTELATHADAFDQHLNAAIGCLTLTANTRANTPWPAKAITAYQKGLSYENEANPEAQAAFKTAAEACEKPLDKQFENTKFGEKIPLFTIDSLIIDQVTQSN